MIHLIRIPDRDERVRALEAMFSVPAAWVRLPGGELFGVTDAHAKALERAGIKFQYVSKPKNAGASAVPS